MVSSVTVFIKTVLLFFLSIGIGWFTLVAIVLMVFAARNLVGLL